MLLDSIDTSTVVGLPRPGTDQRDDLLLRPVQLSPVGKRHAERGRAKNSPDCWLDRSGPGGMLVTYPPGRFGGWEQSCPTAAFACLDRGGENDRQVIPVEDGVQQRMASWPREYEGNLKNIAGSDVSIFLFRFELCGDGIDFVLNEAIAADMYRDVDEKMKPLVHACCETLLRYRHLSVSNFIMDGNILATGEFEVMLSKGLGRHFAHDEKQRLFLDAKNISDLLTMVMDRRTQELKEGKQGDARPIKRAAGPKKIKKGLEELGKAKHRQEKLQWLAEGRQIRPGLRQLRPEDLPPGVTASSGYDHRGQCYVFEHRELGELGRIVLIQIREQEMLMQADLYKGQAKQASTIVKKKKEIFEKVVAIVNDSFTGNFPSSVS